VRYIPPFERLKSNLRLTKAKNGAIGVKAAYEDMLKLIQALLADIEVDETWYLQRHDDVAQGVREGKIKSAKQHFLDHGYFEGRAPFQIMVDEEWYLATNPDVAEQVQRGTIRSAQAHFDNSGYREGRRPHPR